MVSYENSELSKGDDSPDPCPDDSLLNATNFKSISFSRFLAFLRTSISDDVKNENNDEVIVEVKNI